MIDEKKLIEILTKWEYDALPIERDLIEAIIYLVEDQPKVGEWIPCSERMPEEHEVSAPIFDPVTLAETDVRYYTISDLVQITVKDEEGKRFVYDDYTVNGKWYYFNEDLGFEVLAWLPPSEPWEGEADE